MIHIRSTSVVSRNIGWIMGLGESVGQGQVRVRVGHAVRVDVGLCPELVSGLGIRMGVSERDVVWQRLVVFVSVTMDLRH